MEEALCTIAALTVVALATWLSYKYNPTFRAWGNGQMEEEL